MAASATLSALADQFGEFPTSEFRGQTRVVVPADQLLDVMEFLKEDLGFSLLVDITCVDYLNWRDAADRFGLAYIVGKVEAYERLTIRVLLNEPNLEVPSLTPLWEGANWLEREVYDMFGIVFAGHPDLRRILLPPEFTAHPLRKDYPLQGRGERHNFPVIKRSEA